MAARQELHSGLSEMATQTQNYKLHKFELKDAPADITAINASMDIIDTQLKALADGKFDKTGGTISGNLVVNGSTTLKKLTASELDLNGNADVSGTLKVAGATTLTGALAANGGTTTTTLKATGTSTLADVNATNISASGTLKVTGATTLTGALAANGGVTTKALTATSLDLNGNGDVSGTWKVTGATTLTGLLTANGGVTTKKVTATELDLNGNGDVSGNLNVGGLLQVTGHLTTDGNLTAQNVVSRTGYFGVNTGTKSYYPIAVVDYDENGGFCGYRGFGGMTAIGSGESVAALQNSVETEFGMGHGSENLFVCSDQGIWFLPECNSWSNHGTYQLQTNGLCRRLMDVAKGDAIENTRFLQFFLCDKNGNSGASRFAGFEANTRNGTQAMLMAYDPSASSSTYAYLGLAYSSDGVVTTHAPTPPTGDRSTQIATTASFDNEGFIGYKKLTAIQSVKGSFWFDSDSGIDLDDAHLSDIVSGADWYGIQFGMTRGADKSQYLFNSAGIWRRYSDANLGSETWGDWTQIVNTKGLIAATAPEPVTESNDNSIATTKWVRDLLLSAVPTGTILPYAGKTVPSGFMACNGGTISRTTYAKLFAAIGTAWGAGDGSTTFKLPDWRNRTVMGANNANEVGTYLESGAPNITGWHGGHAYKSYDHNETGGAFYGMDEKHGGAGATTNCDVWKMGFDASLSSPIYGASDVIQPPAGKALWIIKT